MPGKNYIIFALLFGCAVIMAPVAGRSTIICGSEPNVAMCPGGGIYCYSDLDPAGIRCCDYGNGECDHLFCTSDCDYNTGQTASCGALANGTYNGTQICDALKGGMPGCYTWGSPTGCTRVCDAGYYLNGASCSQCPNITAQGWSPSMYGSSAAGSTAIGNCYIPGGTAGISDGTGTFTTSGSCAYN